MAACDDYRYGLLGCKEYHDNCTDNLFAAMRQLGLRAPECPSPLNLWMNIPVGPTAAHRVGRAAVQARRLRGAARRAGLHRRDVGLPAGHPADQRRGLQADRGALPDPGLSRAERSLATEFRKTMAILISGAHVVTGDAAGTRARSGRRPDRRRPDRLGRPGRPGARPGAGSRDRDDRRPAADRVCPASINAHMHSNESFEQGAYDNLPLELWLIHSYPPLGGQRLSEREHYLRTMICAIESIRSGVTTVQDDSPGGRHRARGARWRRQGLSRRGAARRDHGRDVGPAVPRLHAVPARPRAGGASQAELDRAPPPPAPRAGRAVRAPLPGMARARPGGSASSRRPAGPQRCIRRPAARRGRALGALRPAGPHPRRSRPRPRR